MGIVTRIVNAIGVLLLGEPISPIRWPNAEWELRAPSVERSADTETLRLQIRDPHYPRLRGTVSINIGFDDRNWVRWRTRASGGSSVADRTIVISDDGYLRGPMLLGRLCCSDTEMQTVRAFLEKQVRPGRDEADPLLVVVPRGPIRPSGGLASEASPEG